jgi:hypothetical protein
MKRIMIWTVLLLVIVTVIVLIDRRRSIDENRVGSGQDLPVIVGIESEPKALIRASLAAYGEPDRIAAIESMKLVNSVTIFGEEQSRAPGRSVEYYGFPDKVRVDFTFGTEEVSHLYDGLNAWTHQGGRVAKAPDYLAESLRKSVKHFPKMLLPAALNERSVLSTIVPDTLSGRGMLTFTLTDGEGDRSRLWFDAESYLLARIDYAVFSSRGSDSMTVVMRDYREIDDIQTAANAVIYFNGAKAQETRIDTVMYDPPLPDSLFVPPDTGN